MYQNSSNNCGFNWNQRFDMGSKISCGGCASGNLTVDDISGDGNDPVDSDDSNSVTSLSPFPPWALMADQLDSSEHRLRPYATSPPSSVPNTISVSNLTRVNQLRTASSAAAGVTSVADSAGASAPASRRSDGHQQSRAASVSVEPDPSTPASLSMISDVELRTRVGRSASVRSGSAGESISIRSPNVVLLMSRSPSDRSAAVVVSHPHHGNPTEHSSPSENRFAALDRAGNEASHQGCFLAEAADEPPSSIIESRSPLAARAAAILSEQPQSVQSPFGASPSLKPASAALYSSESESDMASPLRAAASSQTVRLQKLHASSKGHPRHSLRGKLSGASFTSALPTDFQRDVQAVRDRSGSAVVVVSGSETSDNECCSPQTPSLLMRNRALTPRRISPVAGSIHDGAVMDSPTKLSLRSAGCFTRRDTHSRGHRPMVQGHSSLLQSSPTYELPLALRASSKESNPLALCTSDESFVPVFGSEVRSEMVDSISSS